MNGKFIAFKGNPSTWLIALLCVMLWISCKDDKPQGDTAPTIELTAVKVLKDTSEKDSILVITLKYEDLDGDIGLDQEDTFPPFNPGGEFQYNLLIDVMEVNGSSRIPVKQPGTTEPENFNQRIPNLTPTGRNRKLSGTIDIQLDATKNYLYPDTVQCTMQILDRALQKSNTVQTGLIPLVH